MSQYNKILESIRKESLPNFEMAKIVDLQKLISSVRQELVVEQAIARGGEGFVIRCHDEKIGRKVAVKIGHPKFNEKGLSTSKIYSATNKEEYVQNTSLLRWQRGVKIQNDVSTYLKNFPAIGCVPIIFVANEFPAWVVMEWIDGQISLEWAKRAADLDIIVFGYRFLKLIHKIHSLGYIHRDIKPNNLMITNDGRPCLIDFMQAKRFDQSDSITSTGMKIGTPQFFSHEDHEGKSHTASFNSDAFKCGATIWCLLAKTLPNVEPKNLFNKFLNTRQSSWRPESIPPSFRPVIAKATDKPDKRYKTLDEMIEAYINAMKIEGIEIPQIEQWSNHAISRKIPKLSPPEKQVVENDSVDQYKETAEIEARDFTQAIFQELVSSEDLQEKEAEISRALADELEKISSVVINKDDLDNNELFKVFKECVEISYLKLANEPRFRKKLKLIYLDIMGK
jgi:serine/threonine protein kinase